MSMLAKNQAFLPIVYKQKGKKAENEKEEEENI